MRLNHLLEVDNLQVVCYKYFGQLSLHDLALIKLYKMSVLTLLW